MTDPEQISRASAKLSVATRPQIRIGATPDRIILTLHYSELVYMDSELELELKTL
jgi:hypothetical protein